MIAMHTSPFGDLPHLEDTGDDDRTHLQERTVARVLRAFAGWMDVRFYPVESRWICHAPGSVQAIQIGPYSAPVTIGDGWIQVDGMSPAIPVPKKIEKSHRGTDSGYASEWRARLLCQVRTVSLDNEQTRRGKEEAAAIMQHLREKLDLAVETVLATRKKWIEALNDAVNQELYVYSDGKRARVTLAFELSEGEVAAWANLIGMWFEAKHSFLGGKVLVPREDLTKRLLTGLRGTDPVLHSRDADTPDQ